MQGSSILTHDTVANSYIESNLFPGQLSSTNVFQFIGVRVNCTIEEVEKRTKEIRFSFHPDKMDDKLDKHLSQNFKISFSDEGCASDSTACCIRGAAHSTMMQLHI